ncbi:MAG: iron-containing alcohol dehydrogenase [Halioglobus sp.]|nr:iron-containing alcohol dehydrogenase [Halioglobus sp.]
MKPLYRARQALVGRLLAKPQPKPITFIGAGAVEQLCAAIAQFGQRRVLIVTDKPLHDLGVLDPALKALAGNGVTPVVYDGVLPDPTEKVVDDGLALYRSNNCDSVLAFGGGSSIDAAKVIALGAANDCMAADCVGFAKCDNPTVPFFAVPSTSGTGSEATFIAVISDNETHAKGGVFDPSLIPRAAALDPEISRGLPAHITAATGIDALTHAIESYIGRYGSPETDTYGLTACKLIFENLPRACADGNDMEAREAMSLASFYGGMAITNALVGYVHAISHNLGAKYGVPHGLGNALVLPHVLELLENDATTKLADIAEHCGMGERSEGDAALARRLIERVQQLNDEVGIPRTTDVIKTEDIDELVAAAVAEGGTYPCPRFFSAAEIRGIIEAIQG